MREGRARITLQAYTCISSNLEEFDRILKTFITVKVLKLSNLGLEGADVEEDRATFIQGRHLG